MEKELIEKLKAIIAEYEKKEVEDHPFCRIYHDNNKRDMAMIFNIADLWVESPETKYLVVTRNIRYRTFLQEINDEDVQEFIDSYYNDWHSDPSSTPRDCPFCGAKCVIEKKYYLNESVKESVKYRVLCENDHSLSTWHQTKEEAIKVWNSRLKV